MTKLQKAIALLEEVRGEEYEDHQDILSALRILKELQKENTIQCVE